MKKFFSVVAKSLGVSLKLAIVGVLFIGNFIMNCVGLLLCAITSQN